jgi:hypothetical protein
MQERGIKRPGDFMISSLMQVALFPLIPIVSWVGGLLIESLLDLILE